MLLTSTLLLFSQVLAGGPRIVSAPLAHPVHQAVGPVFAGRVITESGLPLPGVVVSVQGSSQLTSTNSDGDFLLTLNVPKTVLVFKCQGYREQALPVAIGNPLTVKMYSLKTTAPSTLNTTTDTEAAAEGAASKAQVLTFSEVLPTFPGGDVAYRAYMRQNAHFPEEAQAKGVSGTVYVGFVVDEQGRIVDAEVVRGVGYGFDQEALRLIRLMPWWNPGTMGGKPVRVARTLGVPFLFKEHE